jgi:hypothetical protein
MVSVLERGLYNQSVVVDVVFEWMETFTNDKPHPKTSHLHPTPKPY